MAKQLVIVSAIVLTAAIILMLIEPSWREWIMAAIVVSPIPPVP